MFIGALVGAALIVHVSSAIPLLMALLLLVLDAAAVGTLSRHRPSRSTA